MANALFGVGRAMRINTANGIVFTPGGMRRQIRIHMVAAGLWMGQGVIAGELVMKMNLDCSKKMIEYKKV